MLLRVLVRRAGCVRGVPVRFQENCSRRRKEADTIATLPPRYLGGYDII